MNLSEYKDSLTEAIAVKATFTSDETARRAFEVLVEILREMDMNDQYMQDAWRKHGELPDDAQRRDALKTALAEYRSHDKAVRGEFVLTRRPGVRKGHRNAFPK